MGAGWTRNGQRFDVSVQIGARPHAEVRISQKNTVSWTNSGFEKVCQNFPESPSDVVGWGSSNYNSSPYNNTKNYGAFELYINGSKTQSTTIDFL